MTRREAKAQALFSVLKGEVRAFGGFEPNPPPVMGDEGPPYPWRALQGRIDRADDYPLNPPWPPPSAEAVAA